jgi:hypothetical protein
LDLDPTPVGSERQAQLINRGSQLPGRGGACYLQPIMLVQMAVPVARRPTEILRADRRSRHRGVRAQVLGYVGMVALSVVVAWSLASVA